MFFVYYWCMKKYKTEEERKAAKKAAYRKWFESHREQEKERNRKYNATRKESMKEYNKKYRAEHKEYYQEYMKKWELEHKEERKAYAQEKKRWLAYNKTRRTTESNRAHALSLDYRYTDKGRGLDTGNNIDGPWIEEHIFATKCIYCGDSRWEHLGCDRIDNNLPHTPENCVCACGICNCEREGRKMSVAEFVEYRKTHPRTPKPE